MFARIFKNCKWYDANGNVIPQDKRNVIHKQVQKELDDELHDSGFEGFIKRFVLNIMNKSVVEE
ncbi:hypothetical protein [Streptococcus cuniculipharyngis]|uniref:Uncharacterized protein n=1 Tax=Streptococcus cuniculipharyngis TaxID=1562651 RepID=A0A5C5SC16_9STRE|nr:hypothetical protein [Streptococcus cuniculipharyngis]TWS97152.1 hypothetical protein FRX57_06025 [Streptococcus cuniculipharyngis]